MLIAEILDRKIDYQVVRDDDDNYRVKAKIGERLIHVSFEKDDLLDMPDTWDVVFWETTLDNKGMKFNATKSGNELEVFALVKDVITDFATKNKPGGLKFTAAKVGDSPARAKLYNTFLSRFKLPNYKYERQIGSNDDYYFLHRIN